MFASNSSGSTVQLMSLPLSSLAFPFMVISMHACFKDCIHLQWGFEHFLGWTELCIHLHWINCTICVLALVLLGLPFCEGKFVISMHAHVLVAIASKIVTKCACVWFATSPPKEYSVKPLHSFAWWILCHTVIALCSENQRKCPPFGHSYLE